jgi:hypothetical protein
MPIRKKKDGYYWGSKGPYDTRKKAAEVGAAAGGPVEYSNTGSMSMMGGYGGKKRGGKRDMGGKRGGYDEMEDRLNDLAKRVVKLKGMYRKMRRRIY